MTSDKFSWPYLSVTRFFLAFVVLCSHLAEFTTASGPLKIFNRMGAFNAVLGFLLISGFSIGKSIQRNQQSFFKRRLQRIYPVYLASIVLVFIVNKPQLVPGTFLEILYNLLFLNQIVTPDSFVGPAWSLALEVWLYCLAPLLLIASNQRLRVLMLASFVCYSLYMCGRILFHWKYFSQLGFGLDLALLSFAWISGFAFARAKNFYKYILGLLAGHLLVTAVLKFIYYANRHQPGKFYSDTMPYLASATVLLAMVAVVLIYNHKLPKIPERLARWFDFLGNISYPLYLTHYAVFKLLLKHVQPTWYTFPPIAILIATAFYFAFDSYSQKRMKKNKDEKPLRPMLVKESA